MPETAPPARFTEEALCALLKALADQRAESLNRHFTSIQASTVAFAEEHRRFFSELEADTPAPPVEFATAPNGSIYQTNYTEDGTSFFVPRSSLREMGEEEWLFAKKSVVLNPAYRVAKNAKPDVVAAYFNTGRPADMNRYYPFIQDAWDVYPPELDMGKFSFFYLADNDHNKERKPVWTSIYGDPAGRGWMLSSIAPVYDGDVLKGVVGLDVTVDVLNQIVKWKLPWGASSMLVSRAGTILAATDEARRLLGLGEGKPFTTLRPIDTDETDPAHLRVSNIPDPLLRTDLSGFLGSKKKLLRASSADGTIFIAKADVEVTGWCFFLMVPREALLDEVDKLERSEARLQAELRSREAELAYKIGQYNAARGFVHDLRNAITRLEVPVIRLNRKKREIEDLSGKVFGVAAKSGAEKDNDLRDLHAAITRRQPADCDESSASPFKLGLLQTLEQAVGSIEDVKRLIRLSTAFMEDGLVRAVRNVPEEIDLGSLLHHVVTDMQLDYPRIEYNLPDEAVKIRAIRPIIKAGLDNVLKNAVEASSPPNLPGGAIEVHCEALDDGARVVVRDNGVGISPENLARVTQMGFSTKGEEGHGLGLHFFAVSLSAAGGELSVESEGVGKGATVTVRIKNA